MEHLSSLVTRQDHETTLNKSTKCAVSVTVFHVTPHHLLGGV
nr:MAG TPA: hypothetical protein [Caudoviricetes sp.]DAR72418.1 MAG TPA: hypothetical protein [Caudoviricetes sp.]DAX51136.1 MAG TPA: hypothetical protein [Caudoviricetes sp.]